MKYLDMQIDTFFFYSIFFSLHFITFSFNHFITLEYVIEMITFHIAYYMHMPTFLVALINYMFCMSN